MMMAVKRGRADVVRILLEYERTRGAGSTLELENKHGMTALLWAAAGRWEQRDDSAALRATPAEMVRLLLAAGASVDRPNFRGLTALMIAVGAHACHGSEAVAVAVVEQLLHPPPLGEGMGSVGEGADWQAALPAVGDGTRLPTVPAAGEPDGERTQPAAAADEKGEEQDVGDLLAFGAPDPRAADPNIVEISSGCGFSALHIAAANGKLSLVASLLRAGSSMELRTRSAGESAWNLAVAAGESEVASVLEAAGCDTAAAVASTETAGAPPPAPAPAPAQAQAQAQAEAVGEVAGGLVVVEAEPEPVVQVKPQPQKNGLVKRFNMQQPQQVRKQQ